MRRTKDEGQTTEDQTSRILHSHHTSIIMSTMQKTHGLGGGRSSASVSTAWMGSNIPCTIGANKSNSMNGSAKGHPDEKDRNPMGTSSAAAEVTPALPSAETEAVITRDDSTSSLESLGQNFVSGGMEHCDDTGPAQTMIGETDTADISTGTRTHGSATNDKELAAVRVGIKGRILDRWMYKSKQSSPELDVAEAERLEKDLKVEDISKSLKDVLLEEDDMGI